ncbi:MAG TPA: OmpH family outer membrane protein [Tepidisphaeraceae bacterium]|jgi:Skp family chaperone for outer membrane proteins|nr:OmpH family outer membrane protein [Tepidisphaeraceae bacterium]
MKLVRIAPMFAIVAVCSWALPAMAQIKIATVNAARVFNEIQETKDLKTKMENDQKTLQAQDLDKKTKVKDLQSARDALKADSPQYAKANQDLMQAAVDYEVWQRVQGANIQRDQKQQMLNIFNKITSAVGDVAAQKGLDLVIAEQKPDIPENIDQVNVDQLRLLINQRNVLFSTPAVDISSDVIAAMDAKYKSGK